MNNIKITIGTPVTYSNGRDSYPYYVTFVSKDQKQVGLAHAEYTLDDYASGTGTVKPFNPNATTAKYLVKFRGTWWTANMDENGKLIRDRNKFSKYGWYTFGSASVYRDPHF